MESNTAAHAAVSPDQSLLVGPIGSKSLTIGITGVLLLAIWLFARFGDSTSAAPIVPALGPFASPQAFIATPGLNFAHIHIRSGAGAEYAILETIDRGTPLIGVARTSDSKTAFWIELADGRGFVKESVVTPQGEGAAP